MEESERTVASESSVNIELKNFSDELINLPHISQYIQQLEEKIKIQDKDILILKEELISQKKQNEILEKSYIDSESQTDWLEIDGKPSNQEWITDKTKKNSSIVDQVTEAAESALLQTGYVYEKTTGLYYHYDSGYYYDAKMGLYYNGNTGTYYYYDKESETYKFHSQIHRDSTESASPAPASPARVKKKERRIKNKDRTKKIKLMHKEEKLEGTEPEDGECSDSEDKESSSSKDEISTLSSNSDSEFERDEDAAKDYPPCMRIVVQETNVANLKIGTLFMVTYTGGSVGREGDHSVIIPDINVSKYHAKLQYNDMKKVYEVIDLGSRNGTLLNGKRLSVSKQESEPAEIAHGSILQLSSTKLLCHIHDGNDTCGYCEPGLLQSDTIAERKIYSKKKRHKSELKRLKSKFGLEQSNIEAASCVAPGYQDRSHSRREHFGSSCDYAKTHQSSLDASIPKDNLGFKMLSKMGWTEGESLGRSGEGATEPIPIQPNLSKAGLGSEDYGCSVETNSNIEKKQVIWRKTQQRFNECDESEII